MATVNPSVTLIGDDTVQFVYSGLSTTNADGAPIGPNHSDYADRSIEVRGTFGAGGTLVLEGAAMSSSPVYTALNDAQGNPLSFTGQKFEQVENVPALMRPRVTGGDGTTSITCIITCRRNPYR